MIEGQRSDISATRSDTMQMIKANRAMLAYCLALGTAILAITPPRERPFATVKTRISAPETSINTSNQLGSCRTSEGKSVFVGVTDGTDTCLNFQDVDDEKGEPHTRYSTFLYNGTEMCTVFDFKTGASDLLTFGSSCPNPINIGE